MSCFLFLDVDGYCSGGVQQNLIISAGADGYRARELGWALFTRHVSSSGSVYFFDPPRVNGLYPICRSAPSIQYVHHSVHGLPVAPLRQGYGNEVVLPSDHLLTAIAVLCRAAESLCEGGDLVIVHKGGNEGKWVHAMHPKAVVLDLAEVGCPKVDNIGRSHPGWLSVAGPPCRHHWHLSGSRPGKRKGKKGVVHCPLMEVRLLSIWVALSGEVLLSE